MTERHTSQGRARGQKHGTLDREPVSVPHDATDMWARGSHAATNERTAKGGTKTVTSRQTIAGPGCWCGLPMGHAWGKPGEPHPEHPSLPPRERPIPPRVRIRQERLALQAEGICPTCKGYPPGKMKNGLPWCPTCHGAGVFPPLKPEELAQFRRKMLGG